MDLFMKQGWGERENKNCYLSVFLVVPQSRVSVRMYIGNRVFFFSSLLGDDSIVNLTIVFFHVPPSSLCIPSFAEGGEGQECAAAVLLLLFGGTFSSSSSSSSPPVRMLDSRSRFFRTVAIWNVQESKVASKKNAELGHKGNLDVLQCPKRLTTRASCAKKYSQKRAAQKSFFT